MFFTVGKMITFTADKNGKLIKFHPLAVVDDGWEDEFVKQEQIKLLYTVIDKVIEFLYGGLISDDLFRFLLQAQQSRSIELTSPVFIYLRKLIAAIFNKDMNDKDIIFKTVFIMSQINSPKILPAFSLSLLNQDTFTSEDKEIIRNNARLYIDTLIKEAEIV